ncbi:MAG: hypothetical protein ACRCUY_03480 [Thermoguttaceae bacterium]
MNSVGKMFIVLIFIMSIMFMAFSVSIFTTHTNWKTNTKKLEQELTNKDQLLLSLKKSYEDELSLLNQSIDGRAEKIKSLEETASNLTNENKKLKANDDEHKARLETRENALRLSHDQLANLRGEVEELRKNLRTAQEEWTKLSTELVGKTDESHALSLRLASLRAVAEQLTKDYQNAIEVLRQHNLEPDPEKYSGVPPKRLDGIVTEVRPNGWLEVSVGSDSGVMKGHQLDIVRKREDRSSYIGKVEIIEAFPDSAVAKVIPSYSRGTVQRDDTVKVVDLGP